MAATTSSILKIVLIVFAVIVGLLVVLALIAVPQILKLNISRNETSAIQSIRTIYEAEISYSSNYPEKGFTCSLADLSNSQASIIDSTLSQGRRAEYVFNITNCGAKIVNNQYQYISFEITAVPESPGRTGGRGFCADEDNTIKYDPKGGTNCTTPVE